MPYIALGVMAVGAVLSTVAMVQQAKAQEAAAKGAEQAADYNLLVGEQAATIQEQNATYQQSLREAQAKALEQQAGQERAVSQRAAFEERRRGRLVSSRAQALGAASGAGAVDPTMIDVLGDLEHDAELRALTSLYEGEERARGLDYGAVLERAGGAGEEYAGRAAAAATRASAANRSYLDRINAANLKNEAKAGYLKAGGSLLGSAGSLYGNYAAIG